MPTKREREYYREGYHDGFQDASRPDLLEQSRRMGSSIEYGPQGGRLTYTDITKKPKRKLSAWNKFVKANSKKPRFRYRNGKLNLKKMGVAFRRKRRK